MATNAEGKEEILLRFQGGLLDGQQQVTTEISWPPPQWLYLEVGIYKCQSRSQLTDEQIKTMTHVIRGALYEHVSAETYEKMGESNGILN